MSKHKKVNGKLLQMDKTYGHLKNKQKEKISSWMYEAYKKQAVAGLPDEEAVDIVYEKIEKAEIWIPYYEIESRYRKKKEQFKTRLAGENVPQHIFQMESILSKANQKMDEIEKKFAEYEAFQTEIQKLEAYYTSPQWREDLEADEAGSFPEKLKRGVLSEDGIFNMLERNRELLERLRGYNENSGAFQEETERPDSASGLKGIQNSLYLGVDGCRGGWIAGVLDHGELRLERYQSIDEIVGKYPNFDSFLIDMVVGLRENAEQVRPDELARKELGPRASTVFPVPCRQAVYADTEAKQKAANIQILGKSLSKQTVFIIPKIRELDEFLETHPEYRNRILESHPELDFARLNGAVVTSRKKHYEGLAERDSILQRYLPNDAFSTLEQRAKELQCQQDDLMDAICLAVTGAYQAMGMCETIPESPEQDSRGLFMQLTVPKRTVCRMNRN